MAFSRSIRRSEIAATNPWDQFVVPRLDALVGAVDVEGELLDRLTARGLITRDDWERLRLPSVTKRDKARALLMDILPRKGRGEAFDSFVNALRETEGQKNIVEILELPPEKDDCRRCNEEMREKWLGAEMILLAMRIKHEKFSDHVEHYWKTANLPSPPLRHCFGKMAEIDGAMTIAQGNNVFRLEGDKWKQSHISVNVRHIMACQNKGYILTGDSISRTQYISELENSTQVLATVPEDHLLVDVSTIGHKDKIFVVGGGDAGSNVSQAVSCLDSRTNEWTKLKSMPCGRSACSLATVDSKLFIGGGICSFLTGTNAFECFDLEAEKWINLCPTTNKLCELSILNGKVVATGGSPRFNAVEIYDNATDSWLPLPPMKAHRFGHGACTAEGTKLYVAGGTIFSNFVEYFEL